MKITKIQIRKVNGIPMGRPVNPHPEGRRVMLPFFEEDWIPNDKHRDFEQSVTEHEAPGFEEGEAAGVLQWQAQNKYTGGWYNCGPGYLAAETRQTWIVPTPEKAEVKETLISKEAVLKILEFERMRSAQKNSHAGDFAEAVLYDIIQEIEELPSPPTH